MRTLLIELKKCRRSGVILTMLSVGILGALYAFINFIIRKNSLLSLPLPPMVILMTQLYGMIMVLNLFAIVVATCMIYNIEHNGDALKKMYMLPVKVTGIYLWKFIIMLVLLAICIVIQNIALACIGSTMLPSGEFELYTLIKFTMYSFLTSLPVMALMLLVSSRFENMWITLGIGVAGFFSGMIMAFGNSKLFLSNPFVLIMKPAFSPTVSLDYTIITMSIIETIIFLVIGLWLIKHVRYE
ncbi:ABC-2 family transporter protein [Clostridium acetireducens DSM 10703]|jgi:hypothetical protein|uniref:ABC-2 family transporter protein n=1 Tax=Clostridium acetireducens DSM 10703 TaxID=1121290 RepID=A0A1E8EYE2_9CLOT|nr:ABC transporter permease [Clostridium acetireducens]OFI05952.1 ABC-2 family transporter protein [Clostridium acetireducens DSM 10703]